MGKFKDDLQIISKNTISGKIVQEKIKKQLSQEIGGPFFTNESDQDSNDMIVDGLEGICQFAIQINDKVTEISNRILACEFKISQVSDELLLSKKFTGRINNENSSQLEYCLRRMDGFEAMIKEFRTFLIQL